MPTAYQVTLGDDDEDSFHSIEGNPCVSVRVASTESPMPNVGSYVEAKTDDLVVDRTDQEQHSSVASIMLQMHNNINESNTNNNNNTNNNIVSLSQAEGGVTPTQ